MLPGNMLPWYKRGLSECFDRQLMVLFAAGSDDDVFTQGARIRSRLFYKAKVKSLRMTALIVLAFIVCWTPYQVNFLLSCSPFYVR